MSEIQENVVHLTKHLSNLDSILLHLEQQNIFSRDECEEINMHRTLKMLALMQKKNWNLVKDTFLGILRKTKNGHCATMIEGRMNQEHLKQLITEKRFEESVLLAKFINEELKTKTTKFNYAICLEKNGQVEEGVDTLKELFFLKRRKMENDNVSKGLEKMLEYIKTKELKIKVEQDWQLVENLKEEPKEKAIGNALFYSYLRLGNIEEAIAVGKQIADADQIFRIHSQMLKDERFEESLQLAKIIHEELQKNTTKLNYAICLDKNGELEECVKILEEMEKQEMKEEIIHFRSAVSNVGIIIRLEEEVTRDLVAGHLLVLYWRLNNKERVQETLRNRKQFKFIPSDESLGRLIRIVQSDLMTSNYSLKQFERNFTELNLDSKTKKIKLSICTLSLSSFDRLSADEVDLGAISFSRNGRELQEVTVNEFLDLEKINRLSLHCKNNMSIDLSEEVSMEYAWFLNVKVLDWKEAKWSIQKLILWGMPLLEKSKMKVKEIGIYCSSVDISCLPETIQNLTSGGDKVEVFVSAGIKLPHLKSLTLSYDISPLSHFISVQLTHLHLQGFREVHLSLLPQSITHLKITNYGPVLGVKIVGRRKLDKLILDNYPFGQLEECLSHFQIANLVIYGILRKIASKELLELIKKEIKTIAVGCIRWHEQEKDFESLSGIVDRQADYYLLEGGRGRGMEEKEFLELVKLH